MPKPRRRKQLGRKPKPAEDDDTPSGWTFETKPVEPVRLRPVSPELWRGNLARLREDFVSARKEHGPLRCPLFQNSTSKADPQRPPFDMLTNHVAIRMTTYHDSKWYVTPDRRPVYVKHPIVDVEGKPIMDAQGRGSMCAMPAGRKWTYCGTSSASTRFIELAERGGLALLSAPQVALGAGPPSPV